MRHLADRCVLPATLLALATLASSPATAQVSGTVQVNWQSLQLQVVDTNPGDGITAGYQWLWQQTDSGAFVDGTGFLPETSQHPDWSTTGGIVASRPQFSIQTAYDADTLLVNSSATGGPTVASRVYRQGRMVFIGEGRIDASVAMQAEVVAGPGQADAWAYADANLLFADSAWNALSTVAYARADPLNGGHAAELLQTSLSFHHGDQAQLLSQPGVVLQPVPEPGSWALMAAGLATVLGWRRRGGRQSAGGGSCVASSRSIASA